MREQTADLLKLIVRCELECDLAGRALWSRERDRANAVELLMQLGGSAFGEINVVKVEGAVYVVRLDLEECKLIGIDLPHFIDDQILRTGGG